MRARVALGTPRFEVENPCTGELITFTGESFYQDTSVGQPVHFVDFGVHFVALPSGQFKVTRDVPLNVECRG